MKGIFSNWDASRTLRIVLGAVVIAAGLIAGKTILTILGVFICLHALVVSRCPLCDMLLPSKKSQQKPVYKNIIKKYEQ
ncbi:MAG: DUF2892 domain-containing protein [Muribaculaceae bacterium]|jgi:hypothetical protein|nr:DUF2892 domain-containing protein [Muribaculaceae bacterium]